MPFNESELENLQLALRYAALGWPCFPVWGIRDGKCLCGGIQGCKPGKHPFGRAVPRGHHDGSTDADVLRRWFLTPFVNVGVDVGRSQAVVLDPDAKHGGLETLQRLEADLGPLPEGPVAESGGGGRHIWLARCPEIIKNFKLPGGIDVLVAGAVIMPPSGHLSGRRYRWLRPPELSLPALPPAWREYILAAMESSRSAFAVPAQGAGDFNPMKGQVACGGLTFATLGPLPAGERNEPVNSCIGSMVAAGLTEDEILAAGEQWAEAQDPPYSLADLRAKVRWCVGKHCLNGGGSWDDDLAAEEVADAGTTLLLPPQTSSVTASAGDDDLLLPPQPTTAPVLTVNTPTPVEQLSSSPPTFPRAACHGLFGDYIQAVLPLTEADPVGVLLSSMTAFGSALGRGPYLRAGCRHRGNLFLLLIGLTGDRKNTAWDVGSLPVKLADPEWAAKQLRPGFGTGEGLVYAIRDDQERQEPVKEKGTTTGFISITVPGVQDKRLCVVEEEFVKVSGGAQNQPPRGA